MLPGLLEREVKLAVGNDLVWPPAIPGELLEERVFESVYVDTPGRTLARAGITLRRRIEKGRGVWQLKLPEGAARREIEGAGGKVPPAQLRALLRAHLACGPFETVAELRTQRLGFRVRADGLAVADVVLDHVDAVDPHGAPIRFRELEIELVQGDERSLGEIRDVLVAAGARVRSGKPKLFRVLGFEPAKPPPRSAAAIEHVRAAIARQVDALLSHDPAVRMGDDVEQLHDLRVATRRLRAILRAGRPLLGPERVEPLRAELGWLVRAGKKAYA